MRWKFLLLFVAAFAASEAIAADDTPRRLRVLCYNIHHGRGTDDKIDLQRLADVIRETNPDLVALQEVDDRTARTDRVDQTARLAELTGLHGRFAKQIDYEGGGYGQALLSKHPITPPKVHWLPGRPERQRRIAAAAVVDLGGTKLTFVSTHLHHFDEGFRTEQTEELNSLFGDSGETVILAGDFNAVPGSKPIAVMERKWASATAHPENAWTFPAEKPVKQLDYIWYRPAEALRVVEAKVIDEPLASDHRPLLVVFEFQR